MNNTTKLGNFISEYSVRNRAGDDIPVYSVTNKEGFCRDYFSKDVASQDRSTYKIVPRGCFAYNPSRINVGSVDWQRKEDRVIVSPLYVVFSVSKELDQQYLYYYLKSEKCLYYIKELASGSVRDNLKLSMLKEFTIPNITLEEQRKAVTVLEQTDRLITLQERQMTVLDELVKFRFVEMFGDPETNPYGWRKTTVGDVCSSVVRGPFGSALKKEFFVEQNGSTYKVYEQKHAIQKSATIGTYYISAEKFGELRRFECRPGDILMSCSGTMGELFQLPSGCERGVINQALCKFTLSDCILPIVFLTYMRQTIGNLETKGSGIQNIAAVSYVKAMPINLPPMEVQRRFAAFVSEVDKSKLAVKQSLEKLETLKKSLMQQYFG